MQPSAYGKTTSKQMTSNVNLEAALYFQGMHLVILARQRCQTFYKIYKQEKNNQKHKSNTKGTAKKILGRSFNNECVAFKYF